MRNVFNIFIGLAANMSAQKQNGPLENMWLWLPVWLASRLSVTKEILRASRSAHGFLLWSWESLEMQLEQVKKIPLRLCTRVVRIETE